MALDSSEAITFTSVLEACETSDQWAATLQILQEVIDGGFDEWQPDDIDYVHYFQAGSAYDCLKHMLLVHALTNMVNDASPFLYLDTHAGTGIYDLNSPEAQRFQNHEGGILSLMKVRSQTTSKTLLNYLSLHGTFGQLREKQANPTGSTNAYLGSPAIAQLFLRPQDAAIFFEASVQVAAALEENLKSLPGRQSIKTEIHCGSSYQWFSKAEHIQTPELKDRIDVMNERRVLALIDPPYDSASSSDKWNIFLVKRIRSIWPESCVLLWHPFVTEEQTTLGLIHPHSSHFPNV